MFEWPPTQEVKAQGSLRGCSRQRILDGDENVAPDAAVEAAVEAAVVQGAELRPGFAARWVAHYEYDCGVKSRLNAMVEAVVVEVVEAADSLH